MNYKSFNTILLPKTHLLVCFGFVFNKLWSFKMFKNSKFILLFFFALLLSQTIAKSEWIPSKSFPLNTYSWRDIKSCNDSTYLLSGYFQEFPDYSEEKAKAGLIFYKTTDYGVTWDSIFSTIKPFADRYQLNIYEGSYIFSKDTIFLMINLADNNCMIAKTLDGGKIWDSISCRLWRNWKGEYNENGEVPYIYPPLFNFQTFYKGFYTARQDSFYFTVNGGINWFTLGLPHLEDEYAYGYSIGRSDVLGNNILIVAYRDENNPKMFKKLLLSDNYGQGNWDVIDLDKDSIAYGTRNYYFRTYKEIWGLGVNISNKKETIIRRTTDRGVTWERLDGGKVLGGIGLYILFQSKDSILVKTSSGLYSSIDNGENWVEEINKGIQFFAMNSWKSRISIALGEDHSRSQIYRWEKETGIEENQLNQNIAIFPSPLPANKSLNIIFKNGITYNNLKLSIIDISGKLVDQYEITGNSTNIQYKPDANLARGAYFLVVESDDGIIAKEKFVLE